MNAWLFFAILISSNISKFYEDRENFKKILFLQDTDLYHNLGKIHWFHYHAKPETKHYWLLALDISTHLRIDTSPRFSAYTQMAGHILTLFSPHSNYLMKLEVQFIINGCKFGLDFDKTKNCLFSSVNSLCNSHLNQNLEVSLSGVFEFMSIS